MNTSSESFQNKDTSGSPWEEGTPFAKNQLLSLLWLGAFVMFLGGFLSTFFILKGQVPSKEWEAISDYAKVDWLLPLLSIWLIFSTFGLLSWFSSKRQKVQAVTQSSNGKEKWRPLSWQEALCYGLVPILAIALIFSQYVEFKRQKERALAPARGQRLFREGSWDYLAALKKNLKAKEKELLSLLAPDNIGFEGQNREKDPTEVAEEESPSHPKEISQEELTEKRLLLDRCQRILKYGIGPLEEGTQKNGPHERALFAYQMFHLLPNKEFADELKAKQNRLQFQLQDLVNRQLDREQDNTSQKQIGDKKEFADEKTLKKTISQQIVFLKESRELRYGFADRYPRLQIQKVLPGGNEWINCYVGTVLLLGGSTFLLLIFFLLKLTSFLIGGLGTFFTPEIFLWYWGTVLVFYHCTLVFL
ncbi:MAG: hypothetical protein MPJ24_00505 [Pirellulaceae bacterium]|nr:hypothetical protein [Pirellulaceae bacterium]